MLEQEDVTGRSDLHDRLGEIEERIARLSAAHDDSATAIEDLRRDVDVMFADLRRDIDSRLIDLRGKIDGKITDLGRGIESKLVDMAI